MPQKSYVSRKVVQICMKNEMSILLLTSTFWKHRNKENKKRRSKRRRFQWKQLEGDSRHLFGEMPQLATRNSPIDVGSCFWPRHSIPLHIVRLSNVPADYSNPFLPLAAAHTHIHRIHVPGGTCNSSPYHHPRQKSSGSISMKYARKNKRRKIIFQWRIYGGGACASRGY